MTAERSDWRRVKAATSKVIAHGALTETGRLKSGSPCPIGAKLGHLWVRDGRRVTMKDKTTGAPRVITAGRMDMATRLPVVSLGAVYYGMARCYLGVVVGSRELFIARAGSLQRMPGMQLPDPAPHLLDLDERERRSYAESVAQAWAEVVTPLPMRKLSAEVTGRYCARVRSYTEVAILRCGTAGVRRTAKDYARFVSPLWDAPDLLRPRAPTVWHAVATSLVLALDAEHAASLIYLAGLCEYRIQILPLEAAQAIHQRAAGLLATLSPGWWTQAHLWDWSTGGSLEEILKAQWVRMVSEAFGSGRPLEDIAAAPTGAGGTILELRPAPEDALIEAPEAGRLPEVDEDEDD